MLRLLIGVGNEEELWQPEQVVVSYGEGWVKFSYSEEVDYSIVDMQGKTLQSGRIQNGEYTLETVSIRTGLYTIIRRHLMAFEKEMECFGYEGSIKAYTKRYRTEEKLHKPFRDVVTVLKEIEEFDSRLHLCCLLAFGCLLRPHREIRMLTWGDVSEDFKTISLSGSQNKGKRNRIVPISDYIRPHLKAFKRMDSASDVNVFSGRNMPFNSDYFKTLWGRYKKQSRILEKDQTLYSFRHTGAIQVYERTGSLTVLQKVMGHSDLKVTLTYLRGLEINDINPMDLPQVN